MHEIRRVRDNLEVVYDDFVKILSGNPDHEPRFSFESELRVAWYSILAAREVLARTVCRLNPSTPFEGSQLPAPRARSGQK